ncbi:uncharacterized protein EDB91DRAFT_1118823 [Suillus paluster]|uniref:uncharacterized protein n=1 Tax=Suillus paluster TaxID=48578 RepID=UPI001B86731A|nr:uncharacterized protein EDB91DRAFT_1118823 [Suillus paluster]KAG1746772.1 hypothetical protein EDB91DRAFT_1118823 [Suillus paluster]
MVRILLIMNSHQFILKYATSAKSPRHPHNPGDCLRTFLFPQLYTHMHCRDDGDDMACSQRMPPLRPEHPSHYEYDTPHQYDTILTRYMRKAQIFPFVNVIVHARHHLGLPRINLEPDACRFGCKLHFNNHFDWRQYGTASAQLSSYINEMGRG